MTYIARQGSTNTPVLIIKRFVPSSTQSRLEDPDSEEQIRQDIATLQLLCLPTPSQSQAVPSPGCKKEVGHPNITTYLNAFLYDNSVWLILEFLDGGNLKDLIPALIAESRDQHAAVVMKRGTWEMRSMEDRKEDLTGLHRLESQVAAVTKEIAHGLEYIHSKDIIHRQLTSDNILLDSSGRVKIGNFSHSTSSINPSPISLSDAGYWMPPEIFTRGSCEYTEKYDIWSLGTLVFGVSVPFPLSSILNARSEMIQGRPPFHEADQDGPDPSVLAGLIATTSGPLIPTPPLRRRHSKSGSRTSSPTSVKDSGLSSLVSVSPGCKDLLEKIMSTDPESRIGARKVLGQGWLGGAAPLDTLVSAIRSPR